MRKPKDYNQMLRAIDNHINGEYDSVTKLLCNLVNKTVDEDNTPLWNFIIITKDEYSQVFVDYLEVFKDSDEDCGYYAYSKGISCHIDYIAEFMEASKDINFKNIKTLYGKTKV